MLSADKIKELVGEAGAALVQENMILGIGSGSTVYYFIQALSKKVKGGLSCKAVPTSTQTRLLAAEQGIPVVELDEVDFIDLTIDGADETDHQLQLIKGGGGFLLQEKMVAAASKQLIIIADHSKLKTQLGSFPLPVEILSYGWQTVKRRIQSIFDIETTLRLKNNSPLLTEHGHFILDCYFKQIKDPKTLNTSLHLIPGVVETGLFINMCEKAIIGYPDGSTRELTKHQ
jgi:ribose 5-phosphate isomerase A